MPQPTAPASGLQLLTDFSEVQTKDGGSCGDSPHRPRCTGRSSARTLSCGFSEKDPSRGFSKKPSWWTERSFPRMFGV